MSVFHAEWYILDELAKQPTATPELWQRLSQDPPVSRYVLSSRLGRLKAWGWITGARSVEWRPSVMVYTITEQGLRALRLVQEWGYETNPVEIEEALQWEDPAAAWPSWD